MRIAEMDCTSEEQLIRTALSDADGIDWLEFDIPGRLMVAWHRGDPAALMSRLEPLDLGASLLSTEEVPDGESQQGSERDASRVLGWVFGINLTMFAVESVAGWLAESTGLLADSLDMLADAAIYGIALWAVRRGSAFQRTAARVSGWLQLGLALGVLAEVARKAILGSAPESSTMMGTATLALAANVVCLWALARHRTRGVHMQASWIFTANDVIANLGVIVAGVLVSWTGSAVPDLMVGVIIGLVVLRGALRILKLAAARGARTGPVGDA